MELKDTVALMNSEDYKDRFKAEYLQTKIRYEKLDEYIKKVENGEIVFDAEHDFELLKRQRECMREYLLCLTARTITEDIKIADSIEIKVNEVGTTFEFKEHVEESEG